MKCQSNKEKKSILDSPAIKSGLPSHRRSPRTNLGTPKVTHEDANDAIVTKESEIDLISGVSIDWDDNFHDAINADKEIFFSFLHKAVTSSNHPHTVAIKQSWLTVRTKIWNYTRHKDIALCRAFINLSMNSIEGTENSCFYSVKEENRSIVLEIEVSHLRMNCIGKWWVQRMETRLLSSVCIMLFWFCGSHSNLTQWQMNYFQRGT